ncbi:hypothetical protein CONPUDRAFT_80741 [Coniophora puteana RWD-64-598 SS2]|uniref:Aminoglycoside phosphotransferase domain-containing protein n=1 Tax=Coniophora puteana (strain RWD-64-598) TaxID=741705 RepID=A0A5M3MZ15_CONPW|nr:uncharacterized protein CONPUDRAFT_80741 [Coniophora puteana RWD-64-598 SS2]EIW84382.1 hypothetical protein CONPUDRAFT_80741 [Coniophora puteana RWD-64-598 SS2]
MKAENGETIIVHQTPPLTANPSTNDWYAQSLKSEIALSRWLSHCTSLPVPRVLHTSWASPEQPCNVSTSQKLSGEPLHVIYGSLSTESKENLVRSFAQHAVTLFELDIPQQIGSVDAGATAAELAVIPALGREPKMRVPKVCNTLEEGIAEVTFIKRRALTADRTTDEKFRSQATVSQLCRHLQGISQAWNERPALLRCTIAHRNPRASNLFVDREGRITGVLGWRHHVIMPALLGAEYPPWLRDNGIYDPQFGYMLPPQLESPEESARLRAIYAEAVKERNTDYHTALIEGVKFREALEWLQDPHDDPGCGRLRNWMIQTFGHAPQPAIDDKQCIIA